MYGYRTKTWKINEKEKMQEWKNKNKHKYYMQEIFINNGYCILDNNDFFINNFYYDI